MLGEPVDWSWMRVTGELVRKPCCGISGQFFGTLMIVVRELQKGHPWLGLPCGCYKDGTRPFCDNHAGVSASTRYSKLENG